MVNPDARRLGQRASTHDPSDWLTGLKPGVGARLEASLSPSHPGQQDNL